MSISCKRMLSGMGILGVVVWCSAAQALPVFTKMTVNADPAWDRVRIFLNTETEPHNVPIRYFSNPARVQVTLEGTLDGIDEGTQQFADSYLKSISLRRVPRTNKIEVTVMLSAKAPGVKARHYSNERQEFFYIDILRPTWHQQPTWTEKTLSQAKSLGKPVVVIDPGHGGYDPGAISRYHSSLEEKDVNLDIGREVRRLLEQRGRVYPLMTRSGDYFLTLDERVEFLQEHGGELFVSIHSDSAASSSAKGFGVWVIDRSRSDVESDARRLLKYGWRHLLADYSVRQQSVMMDRQERYVETETERIARTMVSSLDRLPGVENRGWKAHPKKLRVLRHNFAPSILIETGFLSNKSDSTRLNQSSHRHQIAAAIAEGIEAYFAQKERSNSHSPLKQSPRYVLADSSPQSYSGDTISYTVRRGDTLTALARKFGVEKEDILIASGLPLSRRILYRDEVLKVPVRNLPENTILAKSQPSIQSPETQEPPVRALPQELAIAPETLTLEKPAITTYEVRPGDNLLRISHMHGTSIARLLDLNRWSDGRKPRAGETILVPANGPRNSSPLLGDRRLAIENLDKAWERGTLSPAEPSVQTVSAPAPAVESVPQFVDYKVRPGDTLSEIASRHGTTSDELRKANNLKNDLIRVEQVLRVPLGNTSRVDHQVLDGENLVEISRRYGEPVDRIRELNNMNGDRILAGEVLRIR